MSVKPILMNTEMVRAILEGRKTMTRRVVKPQPVSKLAYCMAGYKHGTWGYPSDDVWKYWGDAYKRDTPILENERFRHWTPPCHTDDVLWVRETFFKFPAGGYAYKADANSNSEKLRVEFGYRWRPSIHMPREAARIFLRVTGVRVERVQEINMFGILHEGVVPVDIKGGDWEQWQNDYMKPVWDSAIKPADREKYGWAANPFCWVIEFEKCEKPEEG